MYDVTITTQVPTDNTTSPTISIASTTSNTITFSHGDLTGTFVPQYTRYVFNGGTHNWYNNTDYGNTAPTSDVNTLSPTYTWSLTANGGGVASIDATTGVLTLTGAPTGNITVRLTVGNISPLANKTVDFTLTRAAVAQSSNTETVISGPSISPSSAALYYNEGSQAFSASATATATTTNTPAHTTLTGGGNTYYYYNGTLYADSDDFSSITETHPAVTLSWTLGGDAASYLSRTPATGTATTVTHSSQSPSDLTATLTVTASATGATNKTASATLMAYGPMVAPTISRSVNTISLATASTGATIYYTTDGSTPTSGSTPYTGPFDLTTSPTTVKAIALRDGHSSTTATETFQIQLLDPVISLSNTGLATITAEAGATIHYTTDGTTPTASSPTYSAPVQLTNPQTIMAIAVRTSYATSGIATADFITTGVSGTKVILDDRDDHNWTYYQSAGNLPTGYPTAYLSSPDPRNVKITYRGGSVTNGSAVAISALAGEGQNEMIYYKTMEKSVLGMTGDYPYTVISNPFSKRPKVGTTYYGFAGWKVVDGGEYISEYADGDVLPLDTTIHFTDLDNNYTPNCTSAEVIFEATWTAANVQTGNSAPTFSGGTYETNFWVLSGNNNIGDITIPANVTVSAQYPDGTANYTRNLTGTITAGGNNAKVEFVNMNSTGVVNAANYTFTMGRGIVNSGNGGALRLSNANRSCVHTVKIESGKYATLNHFTVTMNAATNIDQQLILGCDYDRAKIDNSKLAITGTMYLAYTTTINRGSGVLFARSNIKSGTFQETVTDTYSGLAAQSYYYGCYGSDYRSAGHRYMLVEGGNIRGLCGGTDHTTNQNANDPAFTLRVRGTADNPVVNGIIYGAAENALCRGRRVMVFTGGTIKGWIAGAANGTAQDQGALTGATYLYCGGTTQVNSNGSTTVVNRAVGGNVFAAGCGYSTTSSSGQVTLGTNLVLADNAYVERGVYGGGSYGYCTTSQTSNLFITGGHVACADGGVNGTAYNAAIGGGVYGGACQNYGSNVNIYMSGGQIDGGLYGGSNAYRNAQSVNIEISGGTVQQVYGGGRGTNTNSCDVTNDAVVTMTGGLVTDGLYGGGNINSTLRSTTVNINGGQVGTSTNTANVHGGGYGANTAVTGNVSVTLGASTSATDSATVYGNVYGGSAYGDVNNNANDNTTVTMNKALVNGNLFGGALGDGAAVTGRIAVNIHGGHVNGSVFGGGDAAAYPHGGNYPVVNMTGGKATNLFGGGKGSTAAVTGNPQVTLSGKAHVTANVYGGGDQAAVTGNPNVILRD